MSKIMLASFLTGNGEPVIFKASDVRDEATKQTVAQFIAKMEQFKVMVDAFLTGEDNAKDVIDRLSEIVAAIKANKDLIQEATSGGLKPSDIVNDLVSGGADKILSAEQGKALKSLIDKIHVSENAEILDGIGKDAKGDLTYNGKTLNGETGIAYGASAEEATNYTGKLQIILEEIDTGGTAPETQPETGNTE